MNPQIGQPIPRTEDLRLLTGRGRYADDIKLDNFAYAAFVRSPHAHARIVSIDTEAAKALPGVLAVLTGADAEADGLQPIPHMPRNPRPGPPPMAVSADIPLRYREGFHRLVTLRPILPTDRARYVGEAVAMVVAETIDAAKDGVEQILVEWDALPSVTYTGDAASLDAPLLWKDEADTNVCIDSDVGHEAPTAEAFARATHTTKLTTWIQRVTGVHMEPRTSIGWFDPETGRYTLYASGGTGVVWMKSELATVLGVPEDDVRVVAYDVGGNFGTRNAFYPDFAAIAWGSRLVGRPVKHVVDRQEAMVSDYQARDLLVEAELALDDDGKFLALRTSNLSNVGAYTVSFTALGKGVELMTGVYDIPAAAVRGRAVLTNTSATVPYRSAGRPEAMFVIERLIDMAAAEHGFDRVELRRRNVIPPDALPFTTAVGLVYDSGDYGQAMETALKMGDWDGFPARRAEARARGKRRGIGVANYIECTSGIPRERADIIVSPEGWVELVVGTLATGQGHETSFAQLVADWLSVPFDCVRVHEGDSDRVKAGGGSHSGRSMRIGSVVIGQATHDVIGKGKRIAAHLFEAAEANIEYADGLFRVVGTNRSLDLFDLAAAAEAGTGLPEDLRGRLTATCDKVVGGGGFPFGCAVCEVEIDPETGTLEIARYSSVDDVGRAINPLLLDGQTHGGIAQGVGQALMEACVYERDSGQLLSGSFMDYTMPRADTLPFFDTVLSEIPSTSHPMGFRPGGEGGTTPALAVVINAIVDALAEYGVRHVEMPATPERLWRAIRGGDAQTCQD